MNKKKYIHPVCVSYKVEINKSFLLTQSNVKVDDDPTDATEPDEVKGQAGFSSDNVWQEW